MRRTSNVDRIRFRVCSEQHFMQLVLLSTLLSVSFSFFHLSSIFLLNLSALEASWASSVMGGEQLCFCGVRRFPVSSTESAGLVQQEPAIRLVCVESWPASAFDIFFAPSLAMWSCWSISASSRVRAGGAERMAGRSRGPLSFSVWNTKSLFKSQYVAMVTSSPLGWSGQTQHRLLLLNEMMNDPSWDANKRTSVSPNFLTFF